MNAGRRRQQELRSEIRWIGRSASPGRTEARYSRTGIFNLRQLSTIERIAAIFGPACALPIWIQFRRPRATGGIEFSAELPVGAALISGLDNFKIRLECVQCKSSRFTVFAARNSVKLRLTCSESRLKGFRYSSSNGNAFQVVSHYRRAVLYEVLLPSWKCSSKIAFNVQFSYQLVPHEDRNNDFGLDHG